MDDCYLSLAGFTLTVTQVRNFLKHNRLDENDKQGNIDVVAHKDEEEASSENNAHNCAAEHFSPHGLSASPRVIGPCSHTSGEQRCRLILARFVGGLAFLLTLPHSMECNRCAGEFVFFKKTVVCYREGSNGGGVLFGIVCGLPPPKCQVKVERVRELSADPQIEIKKFKMLCRWKSTDLQVFKMNIFLGSLTSDL